MEQTGYIQLTDIQAMESDDVPVFNDFYSDLMRTYNNILSNIGGIMPYSTNIWGIGTGVWFKEVLTL